MSFLEELVKKGLIEKSQIDKIKNIAKEKHGCDVDDALLELGVSPEKVLDAKGTYFNIPTKTVDTSKMSFNVLKYIPEDAAMNYRFAPFQLSDGVLEVGIIDPENVQAMDALQFISANLGIPFKIFLISKSDYSKIMENYKGITGQVEEALDELDKDDLKEAKAVSEESLSKE